VPLQRVSIWHYQHQRACGTAVLPVLTMKFSSGAGQPGEEIENWGLV